MFNPYAPKKYPTVKTVGDLKKILEYMEDDTEIIVSESVYHCGYEVHETEEFGLVLQDFKNTLSFCSEYHCRIADHEITDVIDPDEL